MLAGGRELSTDALPYFTDLTTTPLSPNVTVSAPRVRRPRAWRTAEPRKARRDPLGGALSVVGEWLGSPAPVRRIHGAVLPAVIAGLLVAFAAPAGAFADDGTAPLGSAPAVAPPADSTAAPATDPVDTTSPGASPEPASSDPATDPGATGDPSAAAADGSTTDPAASTGDAGATPTPVPDPVPATPASPDPPATDPTGATGPPTSDPVPTDPTAAEPAPPPAEPPATTDPPPATDTPPPVEAPAPAPDPVGAGEPSTGDGGGSMPGASPPSSSAGHADAPVPAQSPSDGAAPPPVIPPAPPAADPVPGPGLLVVASGPVPLPPGAGPLAEGFVSGGPAPHAAFGSLTDPLGHGSIHSSPTPAETSSVVRSVSLVFFSGTTVFGDGPADVRDRSPQPPSPSAPEPPGQHHDGVNSGGPAGSSSGVSPTSALTAALFLLALSCLGVRLPIARARRWRVAVVSPLERPPGFGLL
jgi:hypothetical protein